MRSFESQTLAGVIGRCSVGHRRAKPRVSETNIAFKKNTQICMGRLFAEPTLVDDRKHTGVE
jgi:hypothetical protein